MKEYTLSGFQVNLYGLLFVLPVLLLAGVPFLLIWCDMKLGWPDCFFPLIQQNKPILQSAIQNPLWLFMAPLLIFFGIVMHELIHGLSMVAFTKNRWKSVSFGFNVRALAPFAHCSEPLKPDVYRFTLVMPGILLGDVPVIISWFTGNILFLCFGILFTWAAAGDVTVLWLSRHITGGMLQDHPDKVGFVHIDTDE